MNWTLLTCCHNTPGLVPKLHLEGEEANLENILPHLRPEIPLAFLDIAIFRAQHEQGCFVRGVLE